MTSFLAGVSRFVRSLFAPLPMVIDVSSVSGELRAGAPLPMVIDVSSVSGELRAGVQDLSWTAQHDLEIVRIDLQSDVMMKVIWIRIGLESVVSGPLYSGRLNARDVTACRGHVLRAGQALIVRVEAEPFSQSTNPMLEMIVRTQRPRTLSWRLEHGGL